MDKLQQYSIPFVGLKQGIHHSEFEIKDEFWENYSYATISKSEVSVDLDFDKKNNFFSLNFEINGKVDVECDRCSEYFPLPIHSENKVIVKFNDNTEKTDEEADIIYISRAETEFNVAQLIYELINLCVPLHKVHPDNSKGESTCSKTMLNEIKKHQPQKENKIDPRWAELKKISPN